MGQKYVLHYGNIAGWPYYYALSLRNFGIPSISVKPMHEEAVGNLDVARPNRQLPTDKVIYNYDEPKPVNLLKRVRFTLQCLMNCSLVHYHGATILPNFFDTFLFSRRRIPMIISWAGSDARIISLARKNNSYFFRDLDEAWDNKIVKRLKDVSRYIQYVATDVEMAEYSIPYFKQVFILTQPIDLNQCSPKIPAPTNDHPVVLHIPTRREVKGTAFIESAVEKLKAEGFSFEFHLLPPTFTQKEVREKITEADIYVDELLCGSHGMTSVEAMASGKPTICYIRDDLLNKYPKDLPIVSANPDNIYTQLKKLIQDPNLRYDIGMRSRQYAERYHSLTTVGQRLKQIYEQIGWQP